MQFEDIVRKVQAYRPGEDLTPLRRAYDFSSIRHSEQKRLSGEPYIFHLLEVVQILAQMKLDPVCLTAGMLHDVVEDTGTTSESIEREFGPEVARIVDGVTKIGRIKFMSPEERQEEYFRKMVLAMADDIRVVLVKLSDRLHNMRTLEYLPPEGRERVARETLDIYAPIAHRLGMGKVRGELEDLAFKFLEPEAFLDIRRAVESRRKVSEAFLAEVRARAEAKMKENTIPARIEGRVKRLYSIWQKLQRQHVPLEQVYDLLAIRIITDSEKSCYGALGIIHNTWRPVPGRIKDFIAIPKKNLYQSLHTSVIGPHGQPFEVQIRTEEMHRIAEEGIAAHWKYKDKDGSPVAPQDEERFAWLRHLVESQQEMGDPGEFLSTLKTDLYQEEVYTFTPKGKVIVLPREATPVDFAYVIHTEVGHHCVGAKVNGRIVPLKYKLRSGDIVEIVTNAHHTPSRDWLALVKTSRARNKIRHWVNVAQRQQAVEIGKRLLEKEARKYNVTLKKVGVEDYLRVARDNGCTQADDLHAGIGYGRLSARQVLARLVPSAQLETAHPSRLATVKRALGISGDSMAIQVHGHDDLMLYRARCCNPIRGEEIIGYITRGKGIAVHSKICPNVQNLLYDADRRIEVEWVGPKYSLYPVKLTLFTRDRQGLLADVTGAISNIHSNIQNLEVHTGDSQANVDVTVDIVDLEHLEKIVYSLRKIEGVYQVERVMH